MPAPTRAGYAGGVSAPVVVLAAVLGAAHLAAHYAGRGALAGVLKALPVLLFAATVVRGTAAAGVGYGRLVASGLAISAVGDVSLVFPSGFLAGLGGFFVAHCCYVAAFAAAGVGAGPGPALALAVLAVVAGGMLHRLWPHVGGLGAPVVAYAAVLATMTWTAIARAALPATPEPSGTLAAAGAVAFLVSDGVLAEDRFARPFTAAHGVVMVTYYLAQALIAASAR